MKTAKILTVLAIVLALGCLCALAAADTYGDYTYKVLDNGTAKITNYSGKEASLTIPSSLNGYSVREIGDGAFDYNSSIEYVVIPNGVTVIGKDAFASCSKLKSVVIPDTVDTLGDNPFRYCQSLTTISVSNTNPALATIDNVLFVKATRLLVAYPGGLTASNYQIPQGIRGIGASAFNSVKVDSVTIPDTVTSIGANAFAGSYIKSAVIGSSVTFIGESAFRACSGLTGITVSPDHPVYAEIDGVLFEKSTRTLLTFPAGKKLAAYEIPQGIKAVAPYAFDYCDIGVITVPDSITAISDYGFYECNRTTTFNLPATITSIGKYAFSYCSKLTSIKLPASLESLGEDAFSWCGVLPAIELPEGLTKIGGNCFCGCYALESIVIPESAAANDLYFVFWGCKGLKKVTLPEGMTVIGAYAFKGCKGLEEINIPESVTKINNAAFAEDVALKTITIPAGVASIGKCVFSGNSSNEEPLPELVITVTQGSYAHNYCVEKGLRFTFPASNLDWLLD